MRIHQNVGVDEALTAHEVHVVSLEASSGETHRHHRPVHLKIISPHFPNHHGAPLAGSEKRRRQAYVWSSQPRERKFARKTGSEGMVGLVKEQGVSETCQPVEPAPAESICYRS
jgi:hypothetical protein